MRAETVAETTVKETVAATRVGAIRRRLIQCLNTRFDNYSGLYATVVSV